MAGIVRQKVGPKPRRVGGGGMLSFVLVAAVTALFFVATAGIGKVFVVLVGAVVAPTMFLVLRQTFAISALKGQNEQVSAEARATLLEVVGKTPKYIDTGAMDSSFGPKYITGTGLAFDGESIFVLEDGECARIPWSAVRGWRWEIAGQTRTILYGGDAIQQVQVNEINLLNQAAAYRSGPRLRGGDKGRSELPLAGTECAHFAALGPLSARRANHFVFPGRGGTVHALHPCSRRRGPPRCGLPRAHPRKRASLTPDTKHHPKKAVAPRQINGTPSRRARDAARSAALAAVMRALAARRKASRVFDIPAA